MISCKQATPLCESTLLGPYSRFGGKVRRRRGGAGGGTRGGAAARQQATSTVPTPGLEAQSGTSLPSLHRPGLTQSRPPKFDNVEAHFSTWRSKFLAYLSSLGCLHVPINSNTTANPVVVGDMRVSPEELASRHLSSRDERCAICVSMAGMG